MNFRGLMVSLLIHALGLGSFFIKSTLFTQKNTVLQETPPCTIPLEVTAISEISCAPISKPKVNVEHNDQDSKPEPKPLPEPIPDPQPEPVKRDEVAPDPQPEPPIPDPQPEPVKRDEVAPDPQPEPPTPDPQPEPKITPVIKTDSVLQSVLPQPSKKKPDPKVVTKKSEKTKKAKDLGKKKKPSEKKDSNAPSKTDQKPKKKKANRDFISVLKNLEQAHGPSAETPITDPDSDSEYGAAAVGPTMAMSMIDRVRRLLESAWRVPTAAHTGGALIVTVCMNMNPDGTVYSVVIDHDGGTPHHPAYDVACQSALRAVDRFRDTPLPLPPDCYDQWKEFQFRFIRK